MMNLGRPRWEPARILFFKSYLFKAEQIFDTKLEQLRSEFLFRVEPCNLFTFKVVPTFCHIFEACSIIFSKYRHAGPMLSISQKFHMCVCLSVCLFTFEVPFYGLFAPTS